mgnify:CR=1 FL=1
MSIINCSYSIFYTDHFFDIPTKHTRFSKLSHAKNYALDPKLDLDAFKEAILDGLTPPPGYFPQNVLMNINGYDSIDKVLERGAKPLTPKEFEAAANETEAVLLDTRKAQVFKDEFVPNSINIGIDGSFATWVGTLIPSVKQEILVIADENRLEEVLTRLARVGYDNVLGYLKGGVEAWKKAGFETDAIESVAPEFVAEKQETGEVNLLDVRKKSEYDSEHVEGAVNAPLDYINDSMTKVETDKTYYVNCKSGYRSMAFVSTLRARGYHNLIDVQKGFDGMKASGKFEVTEYVAPTTML